uniref:Sphingomyelin phosphodiesterase n=1 Tax=Caenorhabditis japonica TaxID=281687 RepID=A0A8R1E370_CAEJA
MKQKVFVYLLVTVILLLSIASATVLRTRESSKPPLKMDPYGFQPLCVSCTGLVSVASIFLQFDVSEPVVLEFATIICKLFAKQPWAVCDGISSQFRDEFFYVFRRLAKESPSQICGILLPDCADPTDPSESGWEIPLPPKPKKLSKQKTERKVKSFKNLNVLQLTDLHVDFEYKYPSEADCDDPVCCRKSVSDPKKAAGYWGSVGKCDIPLWTVEHMLKHITDTHLIDMVVMTGDYINHVDWEYSIEEHLSVLRRLHRLVQTSFPTTPVYWALGNHEGVPVNSFAPHSVDQRFWPTWLYKEFHAMSGPWLSEGSDHSLLRRGSYATQVMDGLKLISLNTGFCEVTNFFLYLNQSDPDSSMSWFVKELYESEKIGEQVYVLAHIPPGDSECLEGWAFNYYRVIQRFASTISGQFFGHDHLDYFTVFYEDMHNVSSLPIGVGYAAPSVTTFEYQNPAYRIYEIDPYNKFKIVDFTTYSANLDKATDEKEPVWKKLYSAREAYGMSDLSPLSWNKVIQKLFKSDKRRQQFYKYAFRNESPNCDETCKMQLMCNLRMGHHNSTLYCPTF